MQMLSHRSDSGNIGIDNFSSSNPYLSLNKCTVSWRVRAMFNSQEMCSAVGELQSSSIVTRSLFADTCDWHHCSAILSGLPPQGVIEVWMVVRPIGLVADLHGGDHAGVLGEALLVEGCDMTLRPVIKLALESARLTADIPTNDSMAAAVNCLASECMVGDAFRRLHLKEGFDIVRCFRWSAGMTILGQVVLEWQSRLIYNGVASGKGSTHAGATTSKKISGGNVATSGESPYPTNYDTLCYLWEVQVFSPDGSRRTIRQETSRTILNSGEANSEDKGGGEGSEIKQQILASWDWRRFTVTMEALCLGDLVVLSAKPLSSQQHYSPALLARCRVEARSVEFIFAASNAGAAMNQHVSSATGTNARKKSGYEALSTGSGGSRTAGVVKQRAAFSSVPAAEDGALRGRLMAAATPLDALGMVGMGEAPFFVTHNSAACILPV
jgi:hypothetical protein